MNRIVIALALFLSAVVRLEAQDSARGIAMPVTVTGDLLVSERGNSETSDAPRTQAGFRSEIYPSLRFSPRWFVSSDIQLKASPSSYYDLFNAKRELQIDIPQLFLGYNWTGEESSIGFRIGKMQSAFGSFPLRYRDTTNPLLDQPLAYAYPVKLRPDQRPCGVRDLRAQAYELYVTHYCGGSTEEERTGITPVTMYGLPAAEIDVNRQRVDARFQLTASSPANPQALNSNSQHLQWTAGAGFTIQQGFRVGVSGFRGPFLEKSVRPALDSGTDETDFPAVGIGTDVTWGRGRWSVNAEWQKVRFHYPGFRISPAVSSAYVELKTILTPRFYTAFRGGYEIFSRVEDSRNVVSNHFMAQRGSYEAAIGYHINRYQTLKAGYEWFKTNGISGTHDNVFGVQFLTSVYSLSKAF